MAARKKRGVAPGTMDQKWRERIRTSMIVNRLSDHVFGKVQLSAAQVQSARTLLAKVAPDLQAVQHSGDQENPIRAEVTLPPQLTADEWLKRQTEKK